MTGQIGMEWQRLARLVVHRRVELGYRLQKEFTEASGIKIRTLNNIENHRQSSYDAGTIAMLEQGLKWRPGSVDDVLEGGEPTPVDQTELSLPELDKDQLREILRRSREVTADLERLLGDQS